MKNPKLIAIIGGTVWGNRGAEAMLTTVIGRVREFCPDARFVVFSYYPAKDRQLCSDPRVEFFDCRPATLALKTFPLCLLAFLCRLLHLPVPSHWFGKEVAAIMSSEVLIDIGGITFCDGREVFLPFNVLTLFPAILLRVPVVKLSQAMGPFRSFLNRLFAMPVLSRCEAIFARGGVTLSHLKQTSLPPELFSQAADVAFSYKPEFSLSEENIPLVNNACQWIEQARDEGSKLVTFVPSSLVMQKNANYVRGLADCIEDLIRKGHNVLLLPNATRQDVPKPRNNDLVAIKSIVESLSNIDPALMKKVFAADFDVNTAGLRKMMQASDLVVTSRFHGMVAALALRIPVFVIGWSHKYAEVLADFDCSDNAVDHGAGMENLTDQIMHAIDKTESLAGSIDKNLNQVIASSMSQFSSLKALLCDDEEAIDSKQGRMTAPHESRV